MLAIPDPAATLIASVLGPLRRAGVEGLAEGDTIATTGILFLRPQSPMQFSKVE